MGVTTHRRHQSRNGLEPRHKFRHELTTPAFLQLSPPPPLLAPPIQSVDPIRLISNGNGSFVAPITEPMIEEWTTSPTPLATASLRNSESKHGTSGPEEDEDYDGDPLDPQHIGMDQYSKSRLITNPSMKKPKVKRYHRKEVTTSPIGSYFHESHHVTKELNPEVVDVEAGEESERDTIRGHDYDDYDAVDHYPTGEDDDSDVYQAAGDGDDDSGSSSGGGVFGYSDTYPYEDEDKDDTYAADEGDKDDDKDIFSDTEDDTLESKSEMYIQSGTDNIPSDLRSPEIADVPVDAKEAAADEFMRNREVESDRIFGNLEHSATGSRILNQSLINVVCILTFLI